MCSIAQPCPTLCSPKNYMPTRLLCPRNFPRKNTEMGCHFLLQGILPIQGSNLQAGRFFTTNTTWEAPYAILHNKCLNEKKNSHKL